jgi:hypothetical protein
MMLIRLLGVRSSKALLIFSALALPVPAAGQMKFAAFGDIGNTPNSAAVAKLTRTRNVTFNLLLGDICYGSQPIAAQVDTNYAEEHAKRQLWATVGNHEFSDSCGGGNNASGYFDYFVLAGNERYYDFRRGPVHFFVLNSYRDPDGITASSRQGQWLKAKLAASTYPWKIVFFHHPPYSSGEHGSNVWMRWPFEAWGADAVLSGHDHDYERVMKDRNLDGKRMPYFISGLGGKSRRPFGVRTSGSVKRYNSAFGALFVTATDTSLLFEFRNTSDTLIDSYSMTKSATTQAASPFEFKEPPK